MSLRSYNKFLDGIMNGAEIYDFVDKQNAIKTYIAIMLNRTHSMFKWNNLPDTISERVIELFLQTNGNICFYQHEDNLYIFTGGLGGEPNVYYMPTIYTIANPALQLSVMAKIDIDCVVVPNDTMYMGLLPIFYKYATQLAETDLSINIATVNSRIIDVISAPDDRTRESAIKFLEDVRDGKLGVIAENAFLDGIRALPYGSSGNTNTITNLIELYQYHRASWFNELGLSANYNMKRESLNSGESSMNDDILFPLIDDMLSCRQNAIKKVNAMFGTNITVELASSWEDNQIEIEKELENTIPVDGKGGGESEQENIE